jgi:hypothetical protein
MIRPTLLLLGNQMADAPTTLNANAVELDTNITVSIALSGEKP